VSWQNAKVISHINDHSPFSLSAVFYSLMTWLVLGLARIVGSYRGTPTDTIMLVQPLCLLLLSLWQRWQVTAWDAWGPSAVKKNQSIATALFFLAGVWRLIVSRQLSISSGTSLYVRIPLGFRLLLCKLSVVSRIVELTIITIACGLILTPVPDGRIPNWFRCADYVLDDYVGVVIAQCLVWVLLFVTLIFAASLDWFSVFGYVFHPKDQLVQRLDDQQKKAENQPLVPASRFLYTEKSPYTLYDPGSVMHLSAAWSTKPLLTKEPIADPEARVIITAENNSTETEAVHGTTKPGDKIPPPKRYKEMHTLRPLPGLL
jgi:hypothetical protein